MNSLAPNPTSRLVQVSKICCPINLLPFGPMVWSWWLDVELKWWSPSVGAMSDQVFFIYFLFIQESLFFLLSWNIAVCDSILAAWMLPQMHTVNTHYTKTAKVLCKHQYKDITDLTFVCLNYFSKVCGEFSVAGIDSLIWFCLLKVISFIPMHKYGPLNVSLALWYLKLQQTFPLRHSRDEHWFCCLLCLTF